MTTPDTRRRLHLAKVVALSALLLAFMAPPAPAQTERPTIRPPTPKRSEKVPIVSYVAVILVIAAPLAVNFISSKRGHQD
jgi:hypothetical protein